MPDKYQRKTPPVRLLATLGCFEMLPPPGRTKLVGADASQAWEAFFCPGLGWIDVDPANNKLPSLQHITLGWGRGYGDVSPIRSVLVGSGEHAFDVALIMKHKTKPAHEVRIGSIKAALWKNDTDNGVRFNATFSRLYKDGDSWKSTDSFGRDDLLLLAKVANEAHSWICQQHQDADGSRGGQGSRDDNER